jgi:murein endopeptidase
MALSTTAIYLKEVSMTPDQLKDHVRNSMQHYYNKEQVIQLLNKLTDESKRKGMATVLELF